MTDDEDVIAIIRSAQARTRGYADYWEWDIDRQCAERGVAEALRDFLGISGDVSSIPVDPPDVLLQTSAGRRIGIEVTELIDGRAAGHNRRASQSRAQHVIAIWTVDAVLAEIERRVTTKELKVSKAEGAFDELWLAIATDEPTVDLSMAEAACARCQVKTKHLSRGFLLLGYHPDALDRFPSGCAILPIAIN